MSALDKLHSMISGAKRLMNLTFPRDDGPSSVLLVNDLVANETVSCDFEYIVTVLSDDPEIALKDVQCKMVGIELMREDHSIRHFTGYCFEFRLLRFENSLATYQMILRPWLAFFKLRYDHYIFHNKSIEEQTKEIFCDSGLSSYEFRTKGGDPTRTFSVQYDESDYNYLHRRWEELGWHYWYEHSASGHKLILADATPSADPIDGGPIIPFHHDGGSNKDDKISQWSPARKVVSGKVALSNFDFKTPTPQKVLETSELKQGDIHKIEVYQYQGLYGYKEAGHGAKIAKRRMEQIEAEGKFFEGSGDCRFVQSGRWFRMSKEHDSQMFPGSATENEFYILSARHEISNNFLNAGGGESSYSNTLTCLRRMIPWRPAICFNSELTRVPGIDTATVVGPKGEEIHTDEFGRIKIQFHWDREGKNDEKSSCWVRVMTPWADSNFGMISLPRIGTEVVVQYLHGNADRPVVAGQFYNKRHMPPWDLPANKTQSGILSRSSKGGSPANANAFRFEDKKGEEEVWLHAEKDQRIEVEHDESHWVGHDRKKTIDHDETVLVKHDRTETVDHDETITVHNNRTERVDHNEKISIGDNRTEDVGKNEDIHIGHSRSVHIGDHKSETVGKTKAETVALAKFLTIGGLYQTSVGGAMNTTVAMAQLEEVGVSKTTVVGKTISISAGDQLKITVGKSSFTMHADGRIEIDGTEVLISGSKKVEIHGKDIDNNPG
jgi:type VI secretion system secreted protein VgrG